MSKIGQITHFGLKITHFKPHELLFQRFTFRICTKIAIFAAVFYMTNCQPYTK